MWIAGVKTPTSYVQGLIDVPPEPPFGNYVGKAEGIKIIDGVISELTGGTTNLNIDFGSGTVTGSINFNEIEFEVGNPAAVTNSGFTAEFTNYVVGVDDPEVVDASTINGAFFGPEAEAVAGNFQALVGTDRYLGIFGGDRP